MIRRIPALVAIAALLIATAALIRSGSPDTVYAEGPCAMLGIAELAEHPGAPFLVIDCDGFQFGVPAVMP